MTSLWADERVSYPVDCEAYTPAHHEASGERDPAFRTKLKLAVELVRRALEAGFTFRAVVADSFYGEDRGVRQGLRDLKVGYVLALKPSHDWWHPQGSIGGLKEAAHAARWRDAQHPEKSDQGGAHLPRWFAGLVVGTGSGGWALWAAQAASGGHCHHGPAHPARPVDDVPDHHPAPSRARGGPLEWPSASLAGRGNLVVWLAPVGRAELQAGQTGAGLVGVPGAE